MAQSARQPFRAPPSPPLKHGGFTLLDNTNPERFIGASSRFGPFSQVPEGSLTNDRRSNKEDVFYLSRYAFMNVFVVLDWKDT